MKRIYKYISHCASALLRALPQASASAALALALPLLLGTTSCHKVEVDPDIDGKYEMNFNVVTADSKAYVNETNILTEGNKFKVYAYYTQDFEKVDDQYVLEADADFTSFNDLVTYSTVTENGSTVKKWVSFSDHYWEASAFYKFRAYFPGDFPATITDTDASTPSFRGYSIEAMPDDQVDVLIAETNLSFNDVFVQGTGGQPDKVNPVPLNFRHLLSKIYLQVRMDNELVSSNFEADILAAAFRGVTRTANYSGEDWVGHTGTTDVGMNFTPAKVLTPANNLVSVFEDGILVIPQEVTAGVVTAYIHAVLPIGTEGKTIERPIEIILPASSPAWEPGKQYTYKATITADYNIEFSTPTVALWEGGSTSGTVVIR